MARASIRLRLTAWYVAVLLAGFLAAALVLRGVLRDALRRSFAAEVENTVALVRGFYRLEVAEYGGPDSTTRHMARELVVPARAVDFLRPDDTVLPVAPGMRDPALREGAPHLVERIDALDPVGAPGWRLRTRASTRALDDALGRLDRALLIAAPLALVVAAAFGWWLTGRTLRPVRAMTRATDRITGAGGGALGRLPIADPDDELGQLGGRVNALLARLDAALGQQRRFLADAAHELRTPVARMRSRVELALLAEPVATAPGGTPGPAPADDGDARAVLGEIDADLARASRLVDELLQLARADADPAPPQLVDAFLDDVVADAVGPFQQAARRGGVTLELSRLDEAPARLDPVLVQRLVGILVDNAIRYTPAGGHVDVRVLAEGGAAVLEVEDDGIGVAPEERERVWERFHRGAEARRRAPGGSGLGLAIARLIAERHGATIALDAGADGRGTRVRVRLPAPRADALARGGDARHR